MASPIDTATDPQTYSRSIDGRSDVDSTINEIRPECIRNTIVGKAPEVRFRLGIWLVIVLIIKGTRIFISPLAVIKGR